MNIYIYDHVSLNLITTITEFVELIWTERYQEAGDFELKLNLDIDYLGILSNDNYVQLQTDFDSSINYLISKPTMVIESIELTSPTYDSAGYVVVSGRSLESVLDRRVMTSEYETTEHPAAYIPELVRMCFKNEDEEGRYVGYLTVNDYDDPPDPYDDTSLAAEVGDDLYELVTAALSGTEYGLRLYFNPALGIMTFDIICGKDLTDTVRLSNLNSAFYDSKIVQSTENYKNVAVVVGDNEVNTSTYIDEDEPAGMSRKEITYFPDNVKKKSSESTTKYKTRLALKGDEYLSTTNFHVLTGDGEVADLGRFSLSYNNYYLGDIIYLEDTYMWMTARVVEIIKSWNYSDGYKTYPSLDIQEIGWKTLYGKPNNPPLNEILLSFSSLSSLDKLSYVFSFYNKGGSFRTLKCGVNNYAYLDIDITVDNVSVYNKTIRAHDYAIQYDTYNLLGNLPDRAITITFTVRQYDEKSREHDLCIYFNKDYTSAINNTDYYTMINTYKFRYSQSYQVYDSIHLYVTNLLNNYSRISFCTRAEFYSSDDDIFYRFIIPVAISFPDDFITEEDDYFSINLYYKKNTSSKNYVLNQTGTLLIIPDLYVEEYVNPYEECLDNYMASFVVGPTIIYEKSNKVTYAKPVISKVEPVIEYDLFKSKINYVNALKKVVNLIKEIEIAYEYEYSTPEVVTDFFVGLSKDAYKDKLVEFTGGHDYERLELRFKINLTDETNIEAINVYIDEVFENLNYFNFMYYSRSTRYSSYYCSHRIVVYQNISGIKNVLVDYTISPEISIYTKIVTEIKSNLVVPSEIVLEFYTIYGEEFYNFESSFPNNFNSYTYVRFDFFENLFLINNLINKKCIETTTYNTDSDLISESDLYIIKNILNIDIPTEPEVTEKVVANYVLDESTFTIEQNINVGCKKSEINYLNPIPGVYSIDMTNFMFISGIRWIVNYTIAGNRFKLINNCAYSVTCFVFSGKEMSEGASQYFALEDTVVLKAKETKNLYYNISNGCFICACSTNDDDFTLEDTISVIYYIGYLAN